MKWEHCPECKGTLMMNDGQTGDIVCTSCGFVLQEKTIAIFSKKKSFVPGKHSFYDKPFWGFDERDLSPKMAVLVERLKQCFALKSTTERKNLVAKALLREFLREISPEFRLSLVFKKDFEKNLEKILKNKLKINNRRAFLAALFCLLYQEKGFPNPINEISRITEISKKLIFKNYLFLKSSLNKNTERKIAIASLASFLGMTSEEVFIPTEVQNDFLKIFPSIYKKDIFQGKSRKGLMAGLLFYLFKKNPGYITLDKMVRATSVSTTTIKSRFKELKALLELIELKLKL